VNARLKTLVLHAHGAGWKRTVADTFLAGICGLSPEVPLLARGVLGFLARRYWSPDLAYGALSYTNDWLDALRESPVLDPTVCNVNDLRQYLHERRRLPLYDVIIVLHSAMGDSVGLMLATRAWLDRRRGRLAVFLGNEYDLLAEKIRFVRETGAELLCSQLPQAAAEYLYEDCRGTAVLSLPHALNPKIYTPTPARSRDVDIGFIGNPYPAFIGDDERASILRWFERRGAEWGLVCDLRTRKHTRHDWAEFLRGVKGTIGGEAGTYFLDKGGRLVARAKAFVRAHPQASVRDVYEHCYEGGGPTVSGKAISSRHFEPIGTKTCQVLLEGHYNGILAADEHYIAVRKDLSNIDDAVRRFKDESYRRAMVDRTYDYAMAAHTYGHRIRQLVGALGAPA
jgi:hypothetical protein